MPDRDLDVVVFGATGVTGRRVAAYLAERSADQLAWAAAGRDAGKLARVLAQDGVRAPETIVANVEDPDSLAAMAARARVVLNLVGPYTSFGRPVVAACVAGGASYLDLTGEMPFVRRMIEEFDEAASAAGVKVVHCCGFESLPPDLAVALVAQAAQERFGQQLSEVDVEVTIDPPPGLPRPSDTISGGTIQSMFALAAAEDARLTTDPAALISDTAAAQAVRRASPISLGPRSGAGGAVIAPMAPAAFINPAVIQRSAYLAAAIDGRAPTPFRYREGMLLRGGPFSSPLRWGIAGGLSATQAGLRAITRANPQARRRIAGTLARLAPKSGFGPSGDRLLDWSWGMDVRASTAAGETVSARVRAEGHPGYLATARMLGEAGILIAQEGLTPARAGSLTPAIALGEQCVGRFEQARLRFSLDD